MFDLICSYEKEYSGSIDIEGKSQGYFMLGITSMFVAILVHHIWLLMYTKQFHLLYIPAFIFSFMWLWVIGILEDANPLSYYYQSVYTDMLTKPVIWLQIFMGVTLSVMPIYAWTKYRQFFNGDPIHDLAKNRTRRITAHLGDIAVQETDRT